jgi:hypothetical protein
MGCLNIQFTSFYVTRATENGEGNEHGGHNTVFSVNKKSLPILMDY